MPYPLSLPLDANNKPAPFYNSANITTQTTTLVKTGAGYFKRLVLNKPTSTTTIALYDGVTAAGTLLGTVTIPANMPPDTLPYDIYFATGLTIVTATANSDITVVYS